MQLGRYQILKQLATGSVADVLLARAGGLEGFARHVVIKRIHPELATEDHFARAFLDEARIAGALHHQNIVQVHDIGEQDGTYFFAMEYVHGEDARKLINKVRERGELIPLEHALSIVMATAAGLHHAHEQLSPSGEKLGIVHRDVSPANILIGYDGSVKIVDFGMAKAVARSTTTNTGMLKGKASYMSPEQCTGKPVDRRTDIFGLGVVLFELLTAERLFKGVNEFMTMAAIVEGEIPRPSTLRGEIPAALDEIIMRALHRSPESRYQSAEALRESLEAFALAQELRTSHKALADYLIGLFGQRVEPWEARASTEPIEMDSEGTHTKGLVPAPTAGRNELLARLAPRAQSPMMTADAADGEWGDDDEQVPTVGGGRALARAHARTTEKARPSTDATRRAPTSTRNANDSQPLTVTGRILDDATDSSTVTGGIVGDTTQSSTVTAIDESPKRAAVADVARRARPLAFSGRPLRPTGGDEIGGRTVVEPPVFDSIFEQVTSAGVADDQPDDHPDDNDDDEFASEPATELATDDDPPWKHHGEQPVSARLPPPPVSRSELALARTLPAPRPASRPAGPATPAPALAPRPAPALAPRPAPAPAARPVSAPAPAPPPARTTAQGYSTPPTSPVFPGPPLAAPLPPRVPAPLQQSPPFGYSASPVMGGPGVPPGFDPAMSGPPVDLRGRVRVFASKHALPLVGGGLALLLIVVLAARGCDDDARPSTAPRDSGAAVDTRK